MNIWNSMEKFVEGYEFESQEYCIFLCLKHHKNSISLKLEWFKQKMKFFLN